MIKKINILVVLLLLLVSITAVSAADDLNETVSSNYETVDSQDIISSHNVPFEEISSESNSYTVNESNYNNYFNTKGETTSLVKSGDTLNIDGEFSKKNFTFNIPVNIIGTNSNILNNCIFTFSNGASGSNVSSLNIANNINYHYGIFLNGVSNCIVQKCFINNTGASSYAVCMGNGANYNNVTNNYLNAYGITYGHGTRSTSPLLISGANNNDIANNEITCWDANGIYLSSYAGGPLTGGPSNFNMIYNNTVNYMVLPTSWSYGIQIMGSNNTIKSNKIIKAYRGISVAGSGNKIIGNQIFNITGADFNNPGEEIAGEAGIVGSINSLIVNNSIFNSKILSTGAGISSLDNSIIENNYVQVINSGVGIHPLGSYIIVKDNNISTVSGSGVLFNTHSFNLTVKDNYIKSQSGNGVLIHWVSAKRMPGNITIVGNTLYAGNSKVYAIDAREADKSTNNIIEDNYAPVGYGQIASPNGVVDPSKPSYKFNGKKHIITPTNFDDYIQVNGYLSPNITKGDILIFEGEFVNKLNIIVNNQVKILGDNATFFNTTFKIYSDGVWLENLEIKNSKASKLNAWGVLVYKVRGATVLNCDIEVNDPNAAYAVYVVESTDVDVMNNRLSSSGNYLTYTLLAYSVDDCRFINNTIKTNGTGNVYINTGMDACIDGDENCLDGNENCLDGDENCLDGNENCLDGDSFNGNHVVPAEVYRTYGILMLYSSGNIVSGNKINATSKLNRTVNTTESTNSVIGVDLYYNSHNNIFSNNEVFVKAKDNYLYGMGVLGFKSTNDAPEGQGASNNQFINNNIVLEGTYFVEGFVVGRNSFDTSIISNTVDARSQCVNYGINLEMSQMSLIDKNVLKLNSDIVYGMEIFDSSNNNISKNNFNINAKKVYGLLLLNSNYNNVYENLIIANGSDEEVTFVNFDSISEGNAGIYVKSNCTYNYFYDNNITSKKGYAVSFDEYAKANKVQNNYLDCELGIGNGAVNDCANNLVQGNYKYIVSGELKEVNVKYFENGTFLFTTDDINLNGAKIDFIDDLGEIINSTLISNGNALFIYDFGGFEDYTPASYQFYAKIYQENYKDVEFKCAVTILDGDLIIAANNVTGPIARSAQFGASVKNILGNGIGGITVEFYVVDDGYEAYVGKAVTDKEGVAILNGVIPQIYSENPYVIAKVINPYYFHSTSAKSNLTAFLLDKTKIILNNNVQPGGVVAVLQDEKGHVLANQTVTLKLNSNQYDIVTNSNGAVTIPILSKGNHVVSISYGGNEQYYDSKCSGKITVLPSLYQNKDVSVYYGNTIQYKVRVKGSDGKYGAGNVVTIKVKGKTYHVKTDKNGYATQSVKLKAGSYTITSEFNGDRAVNKLTFKPTLTAKNIVKKKAKKIKFSVKVVDKNGKAVKNKKVSFKIKGKKYTAKTNKKGVATASIKNLKVGKFTITSSYGGCTIKNTIKIKK